jgi:hypothetical protein
MTVSHTGTDIKFCGLLWMFLFGGNLCGLYMISWILYNVCEAEWNGCIFEISQLMNV